METPERCFLREALVLSPVTISASHVAGLSLLQPGLLPAYCFQPSVI